MQIQDRLTAFAMYGASWVLWFLIGLSVIGLAIVIERAYQLLSSRDNVEDLHDELQALLARGDVNQAKGRLSSSRSFEAQIVASGLAAFEKGAAAVEESMASATQWARIQMERNLAFLGTVGNNAPFVGLLGTVIGVIRAFHSLNESSGQVTSGLMSEVGEALVATAVGIIVALPAVAFYNFFQRVIRVRLSRADALGRQLLAFVKTKPTPSTTTLSTSEAGE